MEQLIEAVKYLVSGKDGDHLPFTSADGTPDHRLMGAAWAALHGGYRGQKYAGANKDQAIKKLTSMYKGLKMETPSEAFAGRGSNLLEADTVALQSDSMDALRQRVCCEIQNHVNLGVDMDCDGDSDAGQYVWVCAMFADRAIYSLDGHLYMVSYHAIGDAIALGIPIPVQAGWSTVDDDANYENPKAEPIPMVDTKTTDQESLRESYQFIEADKGKDGQYSITVIKPGFNKSGKRFYPKETLQRDYKVFEGAKMFADHQTEAEEKSRPEGSLSNWVGTLTKVWPESDGSIKGTVTVIDPAFKAKMDSLSSNGMLKDMGVSIRAMGEASDKTIEGKKTKFIESLLHAKSVDFVTFPGAGGQVESAI